MDPFQLGKDVLKILQRANYKAYFVGGCVRNLLLQLPIEDIDIATNAEPAEVMEIFDHVIPIGIEHGTVLVRYKHTSFEITTFRQDGSYSDQRHPDSVEYVDDIVSDLKRRDFTINALAMDLNEQIIDPFGGKIDLDNHIIQTVGDGYERFKEDPLRIIRALRFSSQLGFDIHKRTISEMTSLRSNIRVIATERITKEMEKFFSGLYVEKAMQYLLKTKIYTYLPVFEHYPYLASQIPKNIKPLHSFAEVIALFLTLEPNISLHTWVREWKCSNKTKRQANELIQAITYFKQYGIDRTLVFDLPNHLFDSFMRIIQILYPDDSITTKKLEEIYDQLPIQSRSDLKITGKDLLKLFPHIKRGPWIAHMLRDMEQLVLHDKLTNHYNTLREWAKCHPPKAE